MADLNTRERLHDVTPPLDSSLSRIGEDLEIMDRYAQEINEVEHTIVDEMKRWDREFKDTRLHSTPKARKHLR